MYVNSRARHCFIVCTSARARDEREYFYPSQRSNVASRRSSLLFVRHSARVSLPSSSISSASPPRPSASVPTTPADRNKLYIVHNKIGTVTNDMCIMRAEFYERTVAQRYEGYRIIAAFAICIVGSPAFNTLYCLFYNRNDAFLSAPDKLHAALCPLILEEKRERARPHENSACGPRAFARDKEKKKSCRIALWPPATAARRAGR